VPVMLPELVTTELRISLAVRFVPCPTWVNLERIGLLGPCPVYPR
jgi:hypothetical protein